MAAFAAGRIEGLEGLLYYGAAYSVMNLGAFAVIAALQKRQGITSNLSTFAGLIRREIRGRTHLCRLDPGPLAGAHQWLSAYEHFWTGRLDVLERLLRMEDAALSKPKQGD